MLVAEHDQLYTSQPLSERHLHVSTHGQNKYALDVTKAWVGLCWALVQQKHERFTWHARAGS